MSALRAPALAIAAVGLALSALVALAVVVTGSAGAARGELALGFPGPARRPGEALQIAAHNGRYALAVLIACLAVGLEPRLRPLLDGILAGLLGLNAGLIGFAWGAYGTQLLHAVALHGGVELAALAAAGSAYLHARRDTLTARQLTYVAVLCALLLAVAAGIETYISLEEVPQ